MIVSNDPKVFVIGFHKTGLTSLGAALSLLGYEVCHRAKPVREVLGHDHMMDLLQEKNYAPIFSIAQSFNAFHDNPWFWLYKELDAEFPKSKFILSTRKEKDWLKSANNYFGTSSSDFRQLVYGEASMVGNETLYLNRYRRHNEEVRAWFKNRPSQLLELDIIARPGWNTLCNFLHKPVPKSPFPHLNKRPSSTFPKASRFMQRILRNGNKPS